MLLSIDTSTRYGGVALHRDGRLLVSHTWQSTRNHTVELMPAVEAAVKGVGAAPSDISAVALALGPGGFSALRVGMSVAKGLALGLSVPLVGVRTLEMEAFPYAAAGMLVCPVLPLGKEELAWALYQRRRRWARRGPERLASPSDVVASIPDGVLICGEAAPGLAALVKRRRGASIRVIDSYTPAARLEALAALASLRLAQGQRDDVATLQPFYLRRPSIGKANPPRLVK